MTLRSWLGERVPVPPPRLAARMVEVLGEDADRPLGNAPELFVAAADRLLRDLLARPSAGRESALDLLTVDALATYAFEAAAEMPESISGRADAAMARLAAAVAP